MHKYNYAQCTLDLTLTVETALLLQGQQRRASDEQVAVFFRALYPGDGKERNCIPASSLKGVWRSGVEKILRSFDPELACDPFAEKGPGQSCSKRWEDAWKQGKLEPAAVYGRLCPACRLFGCTIHAGLVRIKDAWASDSAEAQRTEVGIAIDRLLGGVKSGAMIQQRPVQSGHHFTTRVGLDNFEWWQLGLLALVWRDMGDGLVRLGGKTRQGMGRVSVKITALHCHYPAGRYAACRRPTDSIGPLPPTPVLAGHPATYPGDALWLGAGATSVTPQDGDWRRAAWTEFQIEGERPIRELFEACVSHALAPRLQAGGPGGWGNQTEGDENVTPTL